MPENTVSVCRPGFFGNPFKVKSMSGTIDGVPLSCPDVATAIDRFRVYAEQYLAAHVAKLRGRNLACFCPLDQPCHADILLEMANL